MATNIKILKTKVQGPRIAKILRFLTMKNSISLKIVNICWSLHHKASQLAYLGWVLLCFEAFSGLRIYFERSTILPVGRVEDPGSLAIELGYESDSLPTYYLGLPLGVGINLLKFRDCWGEISQGMSNLERQFIATEGESPLSEEHCPTCQFTSCQYFEFQGFFVGGWNRSNGRRKSIM